MTSTNPVLQFNHVALLVASVERSVEKLRALGLTPGEIETFPSEGTKEVYFGDAEQSGKLLLMEGISEGPYLRAMQKRGPGLHHICFDVPDLEAFCESISGSGWLLHPKSLKTMRKGQTLWLARPRAPALIEVHQRSQELVTRRVPEYIHALEIPVAPASDRLFAAFGTSAILPSPDQEMRFSIGQQRISFRELL